MEYNSLQTPFDELHLEECPQEVYEQYMDFTLNVPYIRSMLDPHRPRACDLPRDSHGKIIVDVTKPHILEDMDYFRPSAIEFLKTGKYTRFRPNANSNSEFGKWVREEVRRCFDGYVRESDGEWVTGDMYFFLNYCPIQLIKKDDNGESIRTIDFPSVWEGHYYKTHYLAQCRAKGHHAMELASRGKGKSFLAASMLAKRFILGESRKVTKKVQCVVTASEKKYIQGANQVLDMFQYYIDHCAANTLFPSNRITSSLLNLQWVMGYKDAITGVRTGSENSVIGITSKDDESKLRGSRGVLYLLEEAGSFPRLLNLYQVLRPSVEDGKAIWGLIFGYGTSGDKDSDFSSMQELMYNPRGYNINPLQNVFDKEGQGRKEFAFFFPGYINRAECYDANGNSDISKALKEILMDRYTVKYNSTDINAITKRIAEIPITPQEAILRTKSNIFPVTELNERLTQLDNDDAAYDDVYCGSLVMNGKGEVEFKPSNDLPIRDFPLKDNTSNGCLEIFTMPERTRNGSISHTRYICGYDPYDNDQADSHSLGSVFVFDLLTDSIVAEYTGRTTYAEQFYEVVRLLCIFYNAKCMYESNKKGTFAYFSKMNSTHLLADTPEYLRDKQLIKYSSFGSNSKGINASQPINNYANELIKDWLIKPLPIIVKQDDGSEIEATTKMLYKIRNRALLKELILFNPDINVDRVRALGMVMLYREEKLILYSGNVREEETIDANYLGRDDFFTRNYTQRFNFT